ncbi:helix-turn-helix domain-containing protein [Variovorax sp. KK3]|uniref:helix-turn-helix transcriptional regulator n=1 Tax=Variovorax sp. KK3 TaxID=1855728 RepID=UPI00097BE4D1|nr:helix-turn-helix domain-containing protein [Variovorax sp. KK3]
MTAVARLSSKLPLVARTGFALGHSRQPHYECEWHSHDCAMLLWPQLGGLRSAWLDEGAGSALEARTARLTRSTAVLLPSSTAHRTVAETARQHHGELYLAPELVRSLKQPTAIRLDGATLAMLDALLSPALAPRSAEALVRAIVLQLEATKPVALPLQSDSLAQALLRRIASALAQERALPSIDALACELGVSTRQLQRACRQELGTSPIALRRRMLAAHARALLTRGMPFSQVSAQLGFANSGHLGRLLRDAAD